MAVYTYICENDNCLTKSFTFRRSMEEHDQPTDCPQCGSTCFRKQNDFGGTFQLKGVGWYRDGYNGNSAHSESIKAGKDPYKS